MAIAQLSIDMVAKVAEFEKDLRRATRATEEQTARMSQAFQMVGGAITAMAGALSVNYFATQVRSVADYADQLGKMSQKVGVGVEDLSALAYAAKLADVPIDTLGTGLKKLSKLMQEAAGGSKHAIAVLKEMGTSETADVNKALFDIADRFAVLEDGAGKTALAMEGMGKNGAELIPLLNGGSAALREATAEARKFGVVVTKEAAAAAEKFNDNLTRLATLSKGASIALFGDLVEGVGNATAAFIEGAREGSKYLGIIAAYKTLLTGDARHKNNVQLSEDTDALFAAENALQNLRRDGYAEDSKVIQGTKDKIASLKEHIKTVQAYRKVLDGEDESNKPKPKTEKVDPSIFGGDKPTGLGIKKEIDANAQALASYVHSLQNAIGSAAKLSEEQKALDFLKSIGTTGEITQVRELVLGQAQKLQGMRDEAEAQKHLDEARKQSAKYFDALIAGNASIQVANESLQQHIEEIGLTTDQLNKLTLARLDENIAQQEQTLGLLAANEGSDVEIKIMERKIALLKEQRSLKAGEQIKQASADTRAEQEQASKDYAVTLHNDVKGALAAAFRDSKDPVAAFGDALGEVIFTRVTNSLAEAMATQILGDGKGSTGILSAIGSMIGLPSFAVGTSFVPRDMIAKVHRGEEIVPVGGKKTTPTASPITINITAPVGDIASKSDVIAGMRATANQIVSQITRSRGYGGALA